MHGWVNLYKDVGLGSTPAVSIIRRLFEAEKAGHAGTLDPLASGILPIALGEATKTISATQEAVKIYEVTAQWGAATNTDDVEGEIIARHHVRPTAQQIADALGQFCGEIMQVPPQFSAIRQQGRRAYEAARAGEKVALAPRLVRIDKLELLAATHHNARLRVTCGKGVYIRALIRDLAVALGTCGHVAALARLQVGVFSKKNAIGLEKLKDLRHSAPDLAALDAYLLPLATALDDIPALAISETQASRLKQGQAICINAPFSNPSMEATMEAIAGSAMGSATTKLLANCGDTPIAICQWQGKQIHPVRVFNF